MREEEKKRFKFIFTFLQDHVISFLTRFFFLHFIFFLTSNQSGEEIAKLTVSCAICIAIVINWSDCCFCWTSWSGRFCFALLLCSCIC